MKPSKIFQNLLPHRARFVARTVVWTPVSLVGVGGVFCIVRALMLDFEWQKTMERDGIQGHLHEGGAAWTWLFGGILLLAIFALLFRLFYGLIPEVVSGAGEDNLTREEK